MRFQVRPIATLLSALSLALTSTACGGDNETSADGQDPPDTYTGTTTTTTTPTDEETATDDEQVIEDLTSAIRTEFSNDTVDLGNFPSKTICKFASPEALRRVGGLDECIDEVSQNAGGDMLERTEVTIEGDEATLVGYLPDPGGTPQGVCEKAITYHYTRGGEYGWLWERMDNPCLDGVITGGG